MYNGMNVKFHWCLISVRDGFGRPWDEVFAQYGIKWTGILWFVQVIERCYDSEVYKATIAWADTYIFGDRNLLENGQSEDWEEDGRITWSIMYSKN